MTLLDDIRGRGNYVVVIRPTEFRADRVARSELESVLTRAAVHLRGWDLPHIDAQTSIQQAQEHIGQESDWSYHKEIWRFHRSGQLAIVRALSRDWREDQPRWTSSDATRPNPRELGVIEVLYVLTEVFELAARLAFTPAGDDRVHIQVSVRGIRDRELVVDDPARAPFLSPYVFGADQYDRSWELDRVVLGSEAWDLAADAASEMFQSFGWSAPVGVLRDAQTRLRGPARRRE